jgi:hypothetical protein
MFRIIRLIVLLFPRTRAEWAAFKLGVREFRTDETTNPGEELIEVYDLGRELAHVATLRRYDDV